MDRLWSPWRLEYVTGPKPKGGCVFCTGAAAAKGATAGSADVTAGDNTAASGAGDGFDQASLIVWSGARAYVILNRYPYNNGHLMVVPYQHTSTLTKLDVGELTEVALLVQRSEAVLREAYGVEGINIGINLGKAGGAGIEEHVHVHLVPRWIGDTNFITVIGQTRVLPQDLPTTAALLRPVFARLAEG